MKPFVERIKRFNILVLFNEPRVTLHNSFMLVYLERVSRG